jgi:hypothetical protein
MFSENCSAPWEVEQLEELIRLRICIGLGDIGLVFCS